MAKTKKKGRSRKGQGAIKNRGKRGFEASLSFTLDGRRRYLARVLPTRGEAEAALDELKVERDRLLSGDASEPPKGVVGGSQSEPPELTFGQACDLYLRAARERLRPQSLSFYRTHLAHARSHRENLSLAKLDKARVLELLAALEAEGLGLRSRQAVHLSIRQVTKHAVEEEWLQADPMVGVRRPGGSRQASKRPEGTVRFYEPEELRTFLAVAWERAPSKALVFEVIAETGLRLGETLGLSWAHLDLTARKLRVERQLDIAGDLAEPKWGSRRTVQFSAGLAARLKAHRPAKASRDDLVFVGRGGRPLDRANLRRTMTAVAKHAGLPRRTPHELRHSHATVALHFGVPLKVLSERLGHKDPSVTLSTYAHVMPADQERVAAVMEDVLRGKS